MCPVLPEGYEDQFRSMTAKCSCSRKRDIDWTDIPQCSRLCRHAIVWGASPEDTQTDSEQFRSAPRTGRDRVLQAEGAVVCPLSLSRPPSRITNGHALARLCGRLRGGARKA